MCRKLNFSFKDSTTWVKEDFLKLVSDSFFFANDCILFLLTSYTAPQLFWKKGCKLQLYNAKMFFECVASIPKRRVLFFTKRSSNHDYPNR